MRAPRGASSQRNDGKGKDCGRQQSLAWRVALAGVCSAQRRADVRWGASGGCLGPHGSPLLHRVRLRSGKRLQVLHSHMHVFISKMYCYSVKFMKQCAVFLKRLLWHWNQCEESQVLGPNVPHQASTTDPQGSLKATPSPARLHAIIECIGLAGNAS